MLQDKKRIAIIGAGWCGLGCLRVLKEQGHQIDLYEKLSDIGGVWHPDNCYSGLSIHQPAHGVQYFDFPFPPEVDLTSRLPSVEVFNYLKAYCKAKNLYENMKFKVNVKKVNYNTNSKKSQVFYTDENGENQEVKEYDFVIYTNGFTSREIPDFPGASKFLGSIIHSFDAKKEVLDDIMANNKKVLIIGGSKTAADMLGEFNRRGYIDNICWLYRNPYWFYRFESFTKSMQGIQKGNRLISIWNWILIFSILMVAGFSLRLSGFIVRVFNVLHTYDPQNAHDGYLHFHSGTLDTNQMQILTKLNKQCAVRSDVKTFLSDRVVLDNNQEVPVDVVICCTGSGVSAASLIDFTIDDILFPIEKSHYAYRGRVTPEIPNLIFTAYHLYSPGTDNGIVNGTWVSQYVKGDFDSEYLKKNATYFNFPFFSSQSLFHTSLGNNLEFSAKLALEFVKAGEVSALACAFHVYQYYFTTDLCKPLVFKLPRKKLRERLFNKKSK